MTKIEQARAFAHSAHNSIKQVRKYTGEPYWVHTDEVARIVTDALSDSNQAFNLTQNRSAVIYSPKEVEDAICAAHLHDVVEDVFPIEKSFGIATIHELFGEHVASLVIALTDVYVKEAYPNMNRQDRKTAERERLGKVSALAKTIKLADLISNTKSIVEHDKDFANLYLREKFALLPYLSDGSPILLQRASMQCVNEMQQLGLTIQMISA